MQKPLLLGLASLVLAGLVYKLTPFSKNDHNPPQAERDPPIEENELAAAKFAQSDFGKTLRKLKKFDGTDFVAHELKAPPKYFLLYYAASW